MNVKKQNYILLFVLSKFFSGNKYGKIAEFTGLQGCLETIRTFLGKIGFDNKTLDKRHVMKESKAISDCQYKYLCEIVEFREEDRSIIFLDETWND